MATRLTSRNEYSHFSSPNPASGLLTPGFCSQINRFLSDFLRRAAFQLDYCCSLRSFFSQRIYAARYNSAPLRPIQETTRTSEAASSESGSEQCIQIIQVDVFMKNNSLEFA
ncbi:hypothetical protein CHARACLAT_024892, partial [Characodon lateralis]|nr:hypothetical protein [Characodon lateralis]